MGIAKTYPAETLEEILKVNLRNEKEAVDFYTKILEKVSKEKADFPYEFFQLEHEVRHIIMDEQEHISELELLLETK